jgi:hypothetical protein
MPRDDRTWLAIDANYPNDDKILRAGERAGWLFLAILCRLKMSGRPGVVDRAEIASLGIPGWQVRLERCVRVGLLTESIEGRYVVASWESWQSQKGRAAYMREWRARQRDSARLRSAPDAEGE